MLSTLFKVAPTGLFIYQDSYRKNGKLFEEDQLKASTTVLIDINLSVTISSSMYHIYNFYKLEIHSLFIIARQIETMYHPRNFSWKTTFDYLGPRFVRRDVKESLYKRSSLPIHYLAQEIEIYVNQNELDEKIQIDIDSNLKKFGLVN